MRLNINKIISTIKNLREYIFPVKKLTDKFKSINSIEQLKSFIQERAAHVTQTTLYGYIKTRMGLNFVSPSARTRARSHEPKTLF